MKISTEFKIGFFVILAIAVAYWGINYLKGNDVFNKDRIYYGVYDRIDGLTPSNLVTLNGMPVGIVRSVKLLPEKDNRILVEFAISNHDINIPEGSVARIFSSDLLGSKQVELKLGKGGSLLPPGDTLNTEIEESLADAVNAQIAPLKIKAEELLGQIEKAVVTIQSVFDENARQNLSESFESIKQAFASFATASKRLDSLLESQKPVIESALGNVNEITESLNNDMENLDAIIANFAEISDSLKTSDLKKAIAAAAVALEDFSLMMEEISKGEGTVGKLVSDDSLYVALNEAARNLASLLDDMETNPDRYVQVSVFGKKQKKIKLSDKDIERIKEAVEEDNKNKK